MEAVTVSPKYQVVIPLKVREAMHIRPGEKMIVTRKNGVVHMIPVENIEKARGIARGVTVRELRDETDRID